MEAEMRASLAACTNFGVFEAVASTGGGLQKAPAWAYLSHLRQMTTTSSSNGSGTSGSGGKVVVQVDGVGVGPKGWAMAGAAAGVEFSTGPAEGS